MSDLQFTEGLIAKAPRDGAPDFIKCKLSIKKDEFVAWCQGQEGEWINLDVKEGRSGKWYTSVDTWKPKSEEDQSFDGGKHFDPVDDEKLPF